MKPSFWIIVTKSERGKLYVYNKDMPVELKPKGQIPTSGFVWLKDHAGGPIGLPVSEIASIEWVDDVIREADTAFSLVVNGPPKEEWEDD